MRALRLRYRRRVLTKLRDAISEAYTEKYKTYAASEENPASIEYFRMYSHHVFYSLVKSNTGALRLWIWGNRRTDLTGAEFREHVEFLYDVLMAYAETETPSYLEMSEVIEQHRRSYMDWVNGRGL